MATATGHLVIVAHIGSSLPVAAAVVVVMAGGFVWGVRGTDGTRPRRVLLGFALAGLAFQAVHALEHVLQLAYWLWHPDEAPWLTPWASSGRDVLAHVAGGSASAGNELLHLVGNLIFLAALGALHRWVGAARPRSLRPAVVAQGLHVGEHVALTATTLTLGHAVGVTTGFGSLSPGTALATAVRVWSHFGLNLVATWFALSALWQVTTGTSSTRQDTIAAGREPEEDEPAGVTPLPRVQAGAGRR